MSDTTEELTPDAALGEQLDQLAEDEGNQIVDTSVHGRRWTRLEVERQKNDAWRLMNAGLTLDQISERLSISRNTAKRRVDALIDDMRPHEDYAWYRARQLAELETVRGQMMLVISRWTPTKQITLNNPDGTPVLDENEQPRRITVDVDPVPMFSAVDRLMKVQEREGKLVRFEADVPDATGGKSEQELFDMVDAWREEQQEYMSNE